MRESVLVRHKQAEPFKLHILTFTTSISFKQAFVSNQMIAQPILIDWGSHQHT
jgi:hypothetical protein